MSRQGAVLLLVIGVLSTLFMISLALVGSTKTGFQLALSQLAHSRARLMARSGVEGALKHLSNRPILDQASRYERIFDVDVGQVVVEASDLSGRINVNDGIRAGRLEMGTAYLSGSLNPYEPMFPEAALSAWINLRIRRLLNAYGEVLRYEFSDDRSSFRFLSGAVGERGNALEYQFVDTALGDCLLQSRPRDGYLRLGDIREIVNTWGGRVALAIPTGSDDVFSLIENDLTTSSWEDDTIVRMKDERLFGTFTPQNLIDSDAWSRVEPVPLATNPPNLHDIFEAHPTPVINVNHASRWVRAAVFYAPTNVSLPTVTGLSYQHPGPMISMDLEEEISAPLPNYAHTALPALAMGSTVFEPGKISDIGGNWIDGPNVVQINKLMSLLDAYQLAEAYEEHTPHPLTFDEFRALLHWHWQTWLPDNDIELVRARSNLRHPRNGRYSLLPVFDDNPDRGEFLQNYLELILPEILGASRRPPRWMSPPSCFLSPLYDPVKPQVSDNPGTRGQRTAEDFCYRSPHPKIGFLPEGRYVIRSDAKTEDYIEARYSIKTTVQLHEYRVWRSQAAFESLVQRGIDQTDDSIRTGPEFVAGSGGDGSQEADPHIGWIGVKDRVAPFIYDDPTLSKTIHVSSTPEDVDAGFSDGLPPSSAFGDPYLDPPYEMNGELRNLYGNTRIRGTRDPLSNPFTVMGMMSSATDLSPFGGIVFHGYGHGLDLNTETTRSRQGLYWNLTSPAGPVAPGGTYAGSYLNQGVVNMWVRIPANYPYAHAGVANSTFQTLFSMTVWEVVNPPYGINSSSSQDSALVRPVEIKAGFVWDEQAGRHALVGRLEQSRCGRVREKSRVNNYLYFKQSANNAILEIDPETGEFELEDQDYPLPYLDQDVQPSALMSVPALNFDPNFRHCDQSRLIERRLLLRRGRSDTTAGSWVRVTVWWNLDGDSADQVFGVDLLDQERRQISNVTLSLADYDINDVQGYMPDSLMMSYGTQNIFSLGECPGRGGISGFSERVMESSKTGAVDVPWYSAWRLNSAISEVDVFFGQIPGNYGQYVAEIYETYGKASRFDYPEDQHVTFVPSNLIEDADDPHHDPSLDGATLLSFGVRARYPDSEGHSPDLWLNCYDGNRQTGQLIEPVSLSARGDVYCFDEGPSMNDVSLEAVWKFEEKASDYLVHSIPWIESVFCHIRRPGGVRYLSWQEN